MAKTIEESIAFLLKQESSAGLHACLRGIEKESLRITPQGSLSLEAHPTLLGSALTHPYITTDYSEALLEFITPAKSSTRDTLDFLKQIHQFVYRNIDDEVLWASSMPCAMRSEVDIPVAQYGTSNSGRMKTIYRLGLGHRYGRVMQTIAGIHYNFSFPRSFWQAYQEFCEDDGELQNFINEKYFHLIRNFHRYGWMISYFFGSSPALCKTFLEAGNIRKPGLKKLNNGTFISQYGTSLRMSDIGYSNNAQSQLNVSYNSLKKYVKSLQRAISTPEPLYEAIGVFDDDGNYKQLNANLLQIENEYYSEVRPKQTTQPGERPTLALQKRGVEYIEVRSLDINPFSPIGITEEQMLFIDCFLTFCLLENSPLMTLREQAEVSENHRRIIEFGRKRPLTLRKKNRDLSFESYTQPIIDKIKEISKLYTNEENTLAYQKMVANVEASLRDPEETLSAKVLAAITDPSDLNFTDGGFFCFTQKMSQVHKQALLKETLDEKSYDEMLKVSKQSLESQKVIESTDTISFEKYLENYFAPAGDLS